MHIHPAPTPAVGEPTHADRQRACDRLSAIHGRPVTGGHAVDQLAAEYAACFADGHRAGTQATPDPVVPEPRSGWRQHPIRGGIHR